MRELLGDIGRHLSEYHALVGGSNVTIAKGKQLILLGHARAYGLTRNSETQNRERRSISEGHYPQCTFVWIFGALRTNSEA